jgi:hypothetical protein
MSVVGAERDRHTRYGVTGELSEQPVSVVQFLPRLRVVDPPPVPVRPAVRPDRRAGVPQRADTGVVDPSALSQHAGQGKNSAVRPRSTSRGNATSTSDAFPSSKVIRTSGRCATASSNPLELGDAHPGLVFAEIEFVAGPTVAKKP